MQALMCGGFGGHSLSDDVTEGSPEVTESPTVLYVVGSYL